MLRDRMKSNSEIEEIRSKDHLIHKFTSSRIWSRSHAKWWLDELSSSDSRVFLISCAPPLSFTWENEGVAPHITAEGGKKYVTRTLKKKTKLFHNLEGNLFWFIIIFTRGPFFLFARKWIVKIKEPITLGFCTHIHMMATWHVYAPSYNPHVDFISSIDLLVSQTRGEPMGCSSDRNGEFPPSHPVKCVTEEAQIETLWQNKKNVGIFFPCKGNGVSQVWKKIS
jgi:hypothetical protein